MSLNIIMPGRSFFLSFVRFFFLSFSKGVHMDYAQQKHVHKQTIVFLHSFTHRFSHDPFPTKARAKWGERERGVDLAMFTFGIFI
jgi:hypothetical protein